MRGFYGVGGGPFTRPYNPGMTPVTCPNCGETLDVPTHLLGGPVRCGNCQTVFASPPPGDGPADVPTAAPVRPARRPARDDDDRPRRRRRAGVPGWVWVMLGLVGLASCGCCGGFVWLIGRMMNPEYQPYTSPDGRWKAQFPGPVTVADRPTGRPGETGKWAEAKRNIFGPVFERFFVVEVELSAADRKRRPSEVADSLCDGLRATVGGREVFRRTRGHHQGHDSAEVGFEHPENGQQPHTLARVIVAGGRGYIVGVSGPGQPGGSPWVDEFLDSFEVLDAPPPKADDDAPPPPVVAPPPARRPKPVRAKPAREAAPPPRAVGED
jgi:hypothetical protein